MNTLKVRCPLTKLCFRDNGSIFEPSKENRLKLITKILIANPHYKFKWKEPVDYLYFTDILIKNDNFKYWETAELCVIEELENSLAVHPFSKAEYYNPYWNMNKEEYEELNKEMEKMFYEG